VVPPQLEATVSAMGHPFVLGADPPADELAALWERFSAASGQEAAILANRELFGRLWTAAMLPAAEQACREWRPGLVLHEAAEYASAIAAERCGVAHAQVAISLADVEAASLDLAAPVLAPYGERIVDRLRASPYLTRFPASLDPSPFPATQRFREPADPPRTALPDRWDGSDAPLVYVTFGSVAGGLPEAVAVYRTALEAVAGVRARVLLTVGRAVALDALGPVPDNAHVEAWVPQAEVLREAALVVAHGGSGTTFGTLAAGVPLVLVPLFADQLANAERVAAAGAAPAEDRLRGTPEEQHGDLRVDGRSSGPAFGSPDGAVGLDLSHRRERLLEQAGQVAPALFVELELQLLDLGIGMVEPTGDAGVGRVGHDVAQRARGREAAERGRQLRPLLSVGPRMRQGAIVMLECPAVLPRAHELEEAEPFEDADVVGDVPQWRVECARQLLGTRLAAAAQSLEDELSQWVGERLGEIRVERPIAPGVRAGRRH
jgi:hypothetical protein